MQCKVTKFSVPRSWLIKLSAFIPVRVHQNELWNMINPEQRDGIIATVAMLVILATSLFLRRRSYEFFYYVHLVMALVAIAGTYVHRSGFDSSFIAIICAAIWIPDRAIRGMRYLWNRRGNQATLTPLAAGGVSVELSKPLWRAVPGTHLFLTVPGVNKVQAHPLTIVSTDPLKLVFKAQNGFTRKLREYALSHPGQTLTASVDGPYGTIPTFANYDKVLFLAGGAGASFTFGCALEMLSKTTSATAKSIEFIWTVREHAQLSWFASEIAILKAAPNVSVSIYVTGSSQLYLEKGNNRSIGSGEKVNSPVATNDAPGSISNALFPLEDCETKRPDILAIVQETISSASKDETVAIGACGPTGLINSSRNATAKNIRPGGPRVELHCEDFSW
jgi:predicted ferric reductase